MKEMSLETEHAVDELVTSGRFANRRAVIDRAVSLLRAELQKNGQQEPPQVSPEEWCAQFETWAASHRVLPHEADDRRESIYEGRGE